MQHDGSDIADVGLHYSEGPLKEQRESWEVAVTRLGVQNHLANECSPSPSPQPDLVGQEALRTSSVQFFHMSGELGVASLSLAGQSSTA